MIQPKVLLTLVVCSFFIACTNTNEKANNKDISYSEAANQVVLSSEIQWEALNPARGDQSPMAGTVWGDRKGTVPTGFLAKFVDGFSSPPHIHNVTYRAFVIKGLIHNDDPNAEKMWMPAGSFWTQPAGEAHITAAKGEENIAYVEIDNGPYLVKPTEEASDNGERPINVDISNMIWLDASKTRVIDEKHLQNTNSPKVVFLWESDTLKGNLIQLPAGFEGSIKSDGDIFHAVIIGGALDYTLANQVKSLDAGSYFTAKEKSIHHVAAKAETLVYIRSNDDFWVE